MGSIVISRSQLNDRLRALLGDEKPSRKYKNRPAEYNGRSYDSGHEASVAAQIDWLVRAGVVTEVIPQFRIDLYGRNGTKICTHYVDFRLLFNDGHYEFWEAKGVATDTWRIKRNLTEDSYPDIRYVVITEGRSGWPRRPPRG